MSESQHAFFDAVALWSQVLGAIAFFVVLIYLFRKYLMGAVHAAEAQRNAELAVSEKRREQVKSEVAQARAEVEAADRDAASIKGRVAEDAQREAERIVADAKADGERLVHNAEGELQRARLAAQAHLRSEFIEGALRLARKEAGARIDDRTNARLVTATVESIGPPEKTA
ncbi:MAG: hypothetical protein NVSMB5_02330 [Candidatus Velthaea sp.]